MRLLLLIWYRGQRLLKNRGFHPHADGLVPVSLTGPERPSWRPELLNTSRRKVKTFKNNGYHHH